MSGLIFVTDDLTKRADHRRVYIIASQHNSPREEHELTTKSPRRMAPPQIHQLVSRRSRNRRRTSDGPKNRTVIASSIKDVLEEEVSRRSPIIAVISRHYLRDLHRR